MAIGASAKTKLLLFGEHAAVYGFPAIGVPLPWKIHVFLQPAKTLQWDIPALEIKHQVKLHSLLNYLSSLFPELKSQRAFKISIQSDAPLGVGLGSSGALCTALAKCFYQIFKPPSADNERIGVWLLAHELEKHFHKTPSGIDTGISLFEKLCFFHGKKEGLPLCQPFEQKELFFIVGALPRESDTFSLVAGLKKRREVNSFIASSIKQLGDIAKESISLFQKPELPLKELGQLAAKAHATLKALGLSTPSVDAMLEYGISQGAAGGKLSGAGGGGAYFLFVKNQRQAEDLAEKLKIFSDKNQIFHKLAPTAIFV